MSGTIHLIDLVNHDTSHYVSDAEIAEAFRGTNFGATSVDAHRRILNMGIVKAQMGWTSGHTLTTIMQELGLLGRTKTVLKKGRRMAQCVMAQACTGW